MKKCTRCKGIRNLDEFRKQPQNKDGLQSWCKFCQNTSKDEWRRKNIERVRKYERQKYKLLPERAKGRSLQKFFRGKSWKESYKTYVAMLVEQGSACAICKSPRSEQKEDFAVDHCHTTKLTRGLLCGKCNKGIGLFNDSVKTLQIAVDYLNKFSS